MAWELPNFIEEGDSMYSYPPIYPEFDCRRPCRPPRPDCEWAWDLCPTNVTATVLGVDSCGGIIVRIQRPAGCNRPCDRPEKPCNRPPKPCNCH